jgi:hypothetical protein
VAYSTSGSGVRKDVKLKDWNVLTRQERKVLEESKRKEQGKWGNALCCEFISFLGLFNRVWGGGFARKGWK